ncbi:hypothetical protein [Butyrivibrio sp. XBB1001]|uniref:hypothetical protein n=1 Tax=Butyrivibrio sp. XBB1001 TaxID=1280682 RepID=UPI0003FA527F|nr:hypothetical protein [Butyrivibrio sp. XBB1001]
MSKKSKGLLMYSIGIILVSIAEVCIPYKNGILNYLLYLLTFIKIPLAYLAVRNVKELCSEYRLSKALVMFKLLFAAFSLDFALNLITLNNYNSSAFEAENLIYYAFSIMYITEILLEGVAFTFIISDYYEKTMKILWICANIVVEFFIFFNVVDQGRSDVIDAILDNAIGTLIFFAAFAFRPILMLSVSANPKNYAEKIDPTSFEDEKDSEEST